MKSPLFTIFMPCAAGVEPFLQREAAQILAQREDQIHPQRGGIALQTDWEGVMRLNLHSRLAQRVLMQMSQTMYRTEHDLYEQAKAIDWPSWFTPKQAFKVELTAQHSPLQSLQFALLRVKDAVADRFRAQTGVRPDVQTHFPDVRVFVHLTTDHSTIYLDTSGEALFKRGWRQTKGDAPLKETLAAAMLHASGWADDCEQGVPLYDPCCGSGTVVIEAAQLACRIAPGMTRRFGFEKLQPFRSADWAALKTAAKALQRPSPAPIFGSDIAFRMIDFANHNAELAGVANVVQFRGGDALDRKPPCETPGMMLLNPPYGERIAAAGKAGLDRQERQTRTGGRAAPILQATREMREVPEDGEGGDAFFSKLATHWKSHFPHWSAWVLTPDLKLPSKMRFKESRRVPMWNGPIECRLFRFDITPRRAPQVEPGADSPQHPA